MDGRNSRYPRGCVCVRKCPDAFSHFPFECHSCNLVCFTERYSLSFFHTVLRAQPFRRAEKQSLFHAMGHVVGVSASALCRDLLDYVITYPKQVHDMCGSFLHKKYRLSDGCEEVIHFAEYLADINWKGDTVTLFLFAVAYKKIICVILHQYLWVTQEIGATERLHGVFLYMGANNFVLTEAVKGSDTDLNRRALPLPTEKTSTPEFLGSIMMQGKRRSGRIKQATREEESSSAESESEESDWEENLTLAELRETCNGKGRLRRRLLQGGDQHDWQQRRTRTRKYLLLFRSVQPKSLLTRDQRRAMLSTRTSSSACAGTT